MMGCFNVSLGKIKSGMKNKREADKKERSAVRTKMESKPRMRAMLPPTKAIMAEIESIPK